MKKCILITLIFLTLNLFNSGLMKLYSQSLKDADGNIYSIVNIGKQEWMAEDLKTTKFNDGKKITLLTDDKKWKQLKTPAYCWFDNDSTNNINYGALYNWYAVNTKKLCPMGWHVPSDIEWGTMINSLGDIDTRADKLKVTGNDFWKGTLSTATNETGFSALPGGMRFDAGPFPLFGRNYAVWWSSTGSNNFAWNRGLYITSSKTFRGHEDMRSGFSVRCIKD